MQYACWRWKKGEKRIRLPIRSQIFDAVKVTPNFGWCGLFHLQYIPWFMHTCRYLLYFVLDLKYLWVFTYIHKGFFTGTEAVKKWSLCQPRRTWRIAWHEITKAFNITQTRQNTKTVCIFIDYAVFTPLSQIHEGRCDYHTNISKETPHYYINMNDWCKITHDGKLIY